MSFRLNRSILAKRSPQKEARPIWKDASASRKRRAYGTSHLSISPAVDLFTPSGRFIQATHSAPAQNMDSSPPRGMSFQPSPPPAPRRDYRRAQWEKWASQAIPHLIPIFLTLVRESQHFRTIATHRGGCDCPPGARTLPITTVSMGGLASERVCACKPAVLLLQSGYFPSAPTRPTYAFDVHMLEFVRELHLRAPPNKTAWSNTLESFLSKQGYVIGGQDVIRRKLTMSLKWYTYLRAAVEVHIRKVMSDALWEGKGRLGENERERDVEGIEDGDGSEEDWEDMEDEGLEHLARMCPACFDKDMQPGTDSNVPDIVVCLDACFTQKRRNPVRGKTDDPPLVHPMSAFLTQAELDEAEQLVTSFRPPRTAPPKPSTPVDSSENADSVEPGMKVPKSSLDGCQDSFKAADEKRTKASTTFFADTGLMALLCRHDRVLYIANMKTAGERQYFAVALLMKLFKNLPGGLSVGVMYDIACQLERSCRKWGFLQEYLPRILWAVSVFHAYGHQWACQLVYHPRKRLGFGLADGEGCERFWSAIEFLIPTLRISGLHQRIFTLDVQVHYLREQSLQGLGKWILRKYTLCIEKKKNAEAILNAYPFTKEELETEWEAQVEIQTRPLARATGALAKTRIKAIMALMELSESLSKEIRTIDGKIAEEVDDFEDLVETRTRVSEQRDEVNTQVASKRAALGLQDRQDLRNLIKDKYLQLRLKTFALKERLRAKLQGRKFELERVDRAYQQTRINANESQLHAHINSQIGRHQSSITSLLRRFNSMCAELDNLINTGKAPEGALHPKSLPKEGLYTLDVDSPIWDDSGLHDVDFEGVPRWLGNDGIRRCIPAWLTIRRCDEELVRLREECARLEQWATREWDNLIRSSTLINDEDVRYNIQAQIGELRKLIISWRDSVRNISTAGVGIRWGPDTVERLVPAVEHRLDLDPLDHQMDSDWAGGDSSDAYSESEDSALEVDDRILRAMEDMKVVVDFEKSPVTSDNEEDASQASEREYESQGSSRKRRRHDRDEF